MSSIGSPNPFFIAGKKAYEVERSLRFNDGDTAYLSRTPSSAGNRKKWTFSAWIKRGVLDNTMRIFGGNGNASHIFFYANNVYWDLAPEQSGSSAANIVAARKLRDPSAWFHLVCALDTDESTANNRMRMYINGNEITEFSSRSNPSSGYANNAINNNTLHTIGYRTSGQGNAGIGFDGYMAEINFIDGQQYDASYFGTTDPITGQWNPKKYGGGYGSNGFYLNFSTDTLGIDRSGNGNDFTPNNFSVAAGTGNDYMKDTPTNNFATFNSAFETASSASYGNGNLEFSTSSTGQKLARSTFAHNSGKWYAEFKLVSYSFASGSYPYIGITPANKAAPYGDHNTWVGYIGTAVNTAGTAYKDGSIISGGFSYAAGDIIGMAMDVDNLLVYFYKNGTIQNSGSGYALTSDSDKGYQFAVSFYASSGTWAANLGGIGIGSNSDANGHGNFTYSVPSGYLAECSANLPNPTILLPNKHFDTLLWTGTGASHTLTGLNFQPDWFWAKTRGVAYHNTLIDSVRGSDRILWSNRTNDEQTNTTFLTSFNSDGVTLGDNSSGTGATNSNGHTYVGWNWNAGDTDGKTYTVTVVSDSGNKYRFDGFGTSAVTLDLAEGGTYIFNYPSAHPFRFSETADGTHGGGTEYTTGVTVLSSTSVQIVVAASAPTLYYYCTIHSGMGGAINTNSTLGSSNFDGSKQTVVKANASAGFSIISYTGDGSSGATTGHGLGVAPKIMFHKDRDSTNNWYTITTAVDGSADYLYLNSSTSASNSSVSVPTSSLVYFTSSTESNANGRDYIMYAFSEVAGYSKIGSYTGNGSTDGTFVFTGFRPAVVILKATSFSKGWRITDSVRSPSNAIFNSLFPELNSAEYTATGSSQQGQDFLSNGFKLRNTNDRDNKNGETYIYLAFAESPFKNARAR